MPCVTFGQSTYKVGRYKRRQKGAYLSSPKVLSIRRLFMISVHNSIHQTGWLGCAWASSTLYLHFAPLEGLNGYYRPRRPIVRLRGAFLLSFGRVSSDCNMVAKA